MICDIEKNNTTDNETDFWIINDLSKREWKFKKESYSVEGVSETHFSILSSFGSRKSNVAPCHFGGVTIGTTGNKDTIAYLIVPRNNNTNDFFNFIKKYNFNIKYD